jgi:pantoate--beta-alanine ligase
MEVIKTIRDMQAMSRGFRLEGRSIGFVPTMGALHEGHLSLIRRARDECDVTVVSIFVNPTQFGPQEDFDRYPRDPEGDLKKLRPIGVDVVFMPEVQEMYPHGASITVDVGDIGRILCGKSRPGHFNGVATVVTKLFNIVMPDRAYFGQKDFQQSVIIKRLVRDLDFDIDIVVCPIVREPNGLAMSSRNLYLSDEERQAATILYKALKFGEEQITSNGIRDAVKVKREMERMIASEPLARIDYVEIVDTEELLPVDTIKGPVALCVAVWIGNTRLIDNMVIDTSGRTGTEPASGSQRDDINLKHPGVKSIGGFIEERLGGFMKKIKRLESFDLYNIVISEVEKSIISMVLRETKGNQLRASKLLGINRNTLRSKIKKLGIKIR